MDFNIRRGRKGHQRTGPPPGQSWRGPLPPLSRQQPANAGRPRELTKRRISPAPTHGRKPGGGMPAARGYASPCHCPADGMPARLDIMGVMRNRLRKSLIILRLSLAAETPDYPMRNSGAFIRPSVAAVTLIGSRTGFWGGYWRPAWRIQVATHRGPATVAGAGSTSALATAGAAVGVSRGVFRVRQHRWRLLASWRTSDRGALLAVQSSGGRCHAARMRRPILRALAGLSSGAASRTHPRCHVAAWKITGGRRGVSRVHLGQLVTPSAGRDDLGSRRASSGRRLSRPAASWWGSKPASRGPYGCCLSVFPIVAIVDCILHVVNVVRRCPNRKMKNRGFSKNAPSPRRGRQTCQTGNTVFSFVDSVVRYFWGPLSGRHFDGNVRFSIVDNVVGEMAVRGFGRQFDMSIMSWGNC